MIPYNPSSFNTNKTILEQILELKNWLKDHPSYRVFMSTANGNDSMPDTYNLSDILDDADQLNVGDVVLFSNGCVGSVSSLDVDNQTFDCNLPCVSIKGPQGPRGYTGRGISNAQVDASGDLEITIFDPETSTSTTTNVGHVKGADGTNGTNGTDGAYVSSASVDASGDLQITIYDPATSTSSVVNAGHVVGADGQGIQIIDVATTTGTLSASDLLKVTGTDDCTINYTSVNGTISFKRLFWDTSYAYFTGVYVDTDTYYCVTEVEIATGAFNIDINPIPIKDSNIDSGSATSGQVLTADGNGGASWQTASGGVDIVDITSSFGTLTDDEYNKLTNPSAIIRYGSSVNKRYLQYAYDTSTHIYYEYAMIDKTYGDLLINQIDITKSTKAYTLNILNQVIDTSNINSGSASNGQVLTANGSGGASWQTAGGSQLYKHNFQIVKSNTYSLTFILITDNATPITNWYDIVIKIRTQGYNTSTQLLSVNGKIVKNSAVYSSNGVYCPTGITQLYAQYIDDTNNTISLSDLLLDSATNVYDKVVTL